MYSVRPEACILLKIEKNTLTPPVTVSDGAVLSYINRTVKVAHFLADSNGRKTCI